MRLALSLSALLFAWAAEADARPVRLADTAPKAPRAEQALELLVLHATHRRQGVDPRLKDLPELGKPPFSSYDSYAVLERIRLPLEPKRVSTHALPNGRVLGAELLEVQQGGVLRLAASISEPGGHAFLPLLEVRAKVGQHFIVAGQKWKSGILVLVLTLVR
jgi:hypothetical protein